MKIRTGFVSNSSSSSYVIVGYEDLIDVDDAADKLGLEDVEDLFEDGFYCDDDIFGILLASISDCDEGEVIERDEVIEAFEKMQDLARQLGISEAPKLLVINSYG